MPELPRGRWTVVRGDGRVLYLTTSSPRCVLGRSENLTPEQQLRHPYLSREHLQFVLVSPEVLQVVQCGKNPTFWGKKCERVPSSGSALEYRVHLGISSAERVGETRQVRLPVLSFTDIGKLHHACRDDATLYFPDGVPVPDLHIGFESHEVSSEAGAMNALDTHLSVAQMLAVPGVSHDESGDDEAVESEKTEKERTRAVPAVPPTTAIVSETRSSCTAPSATLVSVQTPKPGEWVWKCRERGKDDDPRSWRPYPRGVQELLERAYAEGRTKVDIPDSLMKMGSGPEGATYGVCFGEKSLKNAMIQYQINDPTRFRVVRRNGGDAVLQRSKVKSISLLPVVSGSEEESLNSSDEEEVDEEDSSESDSLTSDISEESSDEDRRKRRRASKGKVKLNHQRRRK